MDYRQITVVNIAGRMMKKHKAGKLDVHTMEPRSYMIYIHYTLPKHKEKNPDAITHTHTNQL